MSGALHTIGNTPAAVVLATILIEEEPRYRRQVLKFLTKTNGALNELRLLTGNTRSTMIRLYKADRLAEVEKMGLPRAVDTHLRTVLATRFRAEARDTHRQIAVEKREAIEHGRTADPHQQG